MTTRHRLVVAEELVWQLQTLSGETLDQHLRLVDAPGLVWQLQTLSGETPDPNCRPVEVEECEHEWWLRTRSAQKLDPQVAELATSSRTSTTLYWRL